MDRQQDLWSVSLILTKLCIPKKLSAILKRQGQHSAPYSIFVDIFSERRMHSMTKSFTELSAAETMELEGGRTSTIMLPAFGPLLGIYVPSIFKPIIF